MPATTNSRIAPWILCAIATIVFLPSSAPVWGDDVAGLAGESAGQIYELRIYTAAEGKMEALNQRFRDHTLRFFQKHGIKSVGYWTSVEPQKPARLYYLIAYPDLQSREQMLIRGVAVDPEFRKVVAESEQEGKLTTEIQSVMLRPTDYSPLK